MTFGPRARTSMGGSIASLFTFRVNTNLANAYATRHQYVQSAELERLSSRNLYLKALVVWTCRKLWIYDLIIAFHTNTRSHTQTQSQTHANICEPRRYTYRHNHVGGDRRSSDSLLSTYNTHIDADTRRIIFPVAPFHRLRPTLHALKCLSPVGILFLFVYKMTHVEGWFAFCILWRGALGGSSSSEVWTSIEHIVRLLSVQFDQCEQRRALMGMTYKMSRSNLLLYMFHTHDISNRGIEHYRESRDFIS